MHCTRKGASYLKCPNIHLSKRLCWIKLANCADWGAESNQRHPKSTSVRGVFTIWAPLDTGSHLVIFMHSDYGITLGHNANLGAHNLSFCQCNFYYPSERGAVISIRGDLQMTSARFPGFLIPSLPLSVSNPRNLPSFGQNLANPLPPPQNRRHMYMPPYFILSDDFYLEMS